jgi:hypothetical protein
VSDDSLEAALRTLAERLDGLEQRVEALDGLEPRVRVLEVGLLRVERQLHLVFEQGQAVSKQLGEQRRILEGISETLHAVAMRGAHV